MSEEKKTRKKRKISLKNINRLLLGVPPLEDSGEPRRSILGETLSLKGLSLTAGERAVAVILSLGVASVLAFFGIRAPLGVASLAWLSVTLWPAFRLYRQERLAATAAVLSVLPAAAVVLLLARREYLWMLVYASVAAVGLLVGRRKAGESVDAD